MIDDRAESESLRFGILLFPGFQALDAFGPLDCINVLSQTENVSLSVIASSLDPVTTKSPAFPAAVGQQVVPTHTFVTAPPLDVLLVPGGRGTRGSSPLIEETVAFIQNTYPRLKYLITVCTGSGLAARAGVLDGKQATTNKMSWKETTALGPAVNWVPRARWVADGNIWTSAGVSAGIDVTLAWIEEVYGRDKGQKIADRIEYNRQEDSSSDRFAEINGL